jgi:hypothetical protein
MTRSSFPRPKIRPLVCSTAYTVKVNSLAVVLATSLCFGVTGVHGAVTLYSSQASFTSAAGTPSNKATFEDSPIGNQGQTLVDDGILFTSLVGGYGNIHDVYILPPKTLGSNSTAQNSSTALSADGDENFQMELKNGATFGSIGFDFVSNGYNDPIIKLFGVGGVSLGTFTITSAKNAVVYFGAVSDVAIAYVQTTVDRGGIVNTAFDNVALGPLGTAVPEPSSWELMLAGVVLVGSVVRRRGPAASRKA